MKYFHVVCRLSYDITNLSLHRFIDFDFFAAKWVIGYSPHKFLDCKSKCFCIIYLHVPFDCSFMMKFEQVLCILKSRKTVSLQGISMSLLGI